MSLRRIEERQDDPFAPSTADGHWFRNDLQRFLISRLANREDVRDLSQEAFLRYMQTDVRAIRSPRNYLFRIVKGILGEWKERRDRSPVTCNSKVAELRSLNLIAHESDACEQLIMQEQLERVLEQIPLTYRRVLILHRCEDLTYEEIAERLNLTKETVHKYIVRATAYARLAQWE